VGEKKNSKFLNKLPYPAQYFMPNLVQIAADSHSIWSFIYPPFENQRLYKGWVGQYFSLVILADNMPGLDYQPKKLKI